MVLDTLKQTNKLKTKQNHCRNISKLNWGIIERDKIYIPNTNTWLLTFLTWYKLFNTNWRGKASCIGTDLIYSLPEDEVIYKFKLIPIPDPVVWSVYGTLPKPYSPAALITQSKSSSSFWDQLHVVFSKSQYWLKAMEKIHSYILTTYVNIDGKCAI